MIHYMNILILAVIVTLIFLVNKWSERHGIRRFSLIIYGLVSSIIFPLYTRYTFDGKFELWFPIGFLFAMLYLYMYQKQHPLKLSACLLGFAVACFNLLEKYHVFT